MYSSANIGSHDEGPVARAAVLDREDPIAPSERRLLRRESGIAPAARDLGEHGRVRTVLSLQPERARRAGPEQLVIAQYQFAVRRVSVDEIGGGIAGEESRVTQCRDEKVAVGRDAANMEPLEGQREH